MAKIGRVAQGVLNFHLVVKKLHIKNGHPRVTLSAVPSQPPFDPGASFVANLKNGKKTFKVGSRLKKLLRKIDWDKTKLKPLKEHIKELLDQGRKDPSKLVDLLHAFLKKGCRPDFSISLTPEVQSTVPETSSLQLCSGGLQSLIFQIIPERVKRRDGKVQVKLAAILSSAGFSQKAKVLAKISSGKKSYSYSSKLQEVLSQVNMKVSDLQQLKKFLHDTLASSYKDPEIAVNLLSTYLKSKIVPTITVYPTVPSC
jgi:hypothetical protein